MTDGTAVPHRPPPSGVLARWLDRSIANRITLAAASITAVVVLLLGCVAYAFAQMALLRQAEAQLASQAQLIAQRLSLTLGAVARDVEGLAASSLVGNALLDSSGRDAYLQPFLRDHRLPVDVKYTLTLVDHRGTALASTRIAAAPDYGTADWLMSMVERARPRTHFDGEKLLIAAPVLFPATQSVEGGLVLEIELRELFAEMAMHAPGVMRRLMLGEETLILVDAAGSQVIPPPPLARRDGSVLIATEMVAAGGSLSDLPLSIVVKRSDESVTGLLGGLAPAMALIGAGVLLLVAWAARTAASRLTAPLAQLSSTAEAVSSDGSLEHRVPALGSDELGVLAGALNRMLERLRAAHDGLEAQVTSRTAELSQAQQRLAAIVDQMHDGLVLLDADGQIESINRSAEALFDALDADVRGLHMSRLIGGWFQALHKQGSVQHTRFVLTEVVARRGADGSFVADCAVTRIKSAGGEQWSVLVRDVTARRRAEDALRQANDRLTQSVAALKRRDAQMAQINKMNELLQSCHTLDEAYGVIGRTMSTLFPGGAGSLALIGAAPDRLITVAHWGPEVSGEQFTTADCWALRLGRPHRHDGSAQALACPHHVAPLQDPGLCLPLTIDGQHTGVFSAVFEHGDGDTAAPVLTMAAEAIRAALANLKLREALREQALRDRLTGLYNRRYLDDVLPREILRARREVRPLAVAMIDLDHFKRFNDEYGHQAGDHVLHEIAALLRSRLRASDILCRYGGEELTVLMPDTPLASARARLDEIRAQIAVLRLTMGDTALPAVTVSIGATQTPPEGGVDAAALIRAADRALYTAKSTGRNRVVVSEAASVAPVRA